MAKVVQREQSPLAAAVFRNQRYALNIRVLESRVTDLANLINMQQHAMYAMAESMFQMQEQLNTMRELIMQDEANESLQIFQRVRVH